VKALLQCGEFAHEPFGLAIDNNDIDPDPSRDFEGLVRIARHEHAVAGLPKRLLEQLLESRT
jgi:hypothetical protein